MISMTSMELSDDDKMDAPMPIPMPEKPDFPYGLRITLCNDQIEKLDIDPTDAKAGGTFMLQAIARVTSVSCDDRGGEKCWRIEAQIEDMGILGSDPDNDGDVHLGAKEPEGGIGKMIGVY